MLPAKKHWHIEEGQEGRNIGDWLRKEDPDDDSRNPNTIATTTQYSCLTIPLEFLIMFDDFEFEVDEVL